MVDHLKPSVRAAVKHEDLGARRWQAFTFQIADAQERDGPSPCSIFAVPPPSGHSCARWLLHHDASDGGLHDRLEANVGSFSLKKEDTWST